MNHFNQLTHNIRIQADEIDKAVKQLEQNELADSEITAALQLDYVLTRIDHLQDRFHSIIVKPGRGKSYAFEVENALREIKEIKKEIEFWRVEGILPEVLKGLE